MFAMWHLYHGSAGVVEAVIIALVFNEVFIWRKSLIPIAIAHAGYNAPIVLI